MTRSGRGVQVLLLVAPLVQALSERGIIAPSGALSVVASAIGILALLLRRRWPVPVLAVTLAAVSVTNLAAANMVALYTVAKRPGRRNAIVAAGVVSAVVLAVPWPWLEPTYLLDLSQLRNVRILLLRILTMVGGPIALGLMVQARREAAAALAEVLRGRERERRLAATTAVARERVQLAREMHDVVAHNVGLIALRAGSLQVTAPGDVAVGAAAAAIHELSAATLGELREMVAVLRGPHGADPPRRTRLRDIRALVENSGIVVDLAIDDAVLGASWPDPVERAAYRTVQEGLTNARKYAHGAPVRVAITSAAGALEVAVRNGPGAAPEPGLPSGGFGLIGLGERAALMHGTFDAGGTADGGFLVRARYPAGQPLALDTASGPPAR